MILPSIIPPWGYAAAAGLAVIGSFGAGWQVRSWRCEAAVGRQLEREARESARLQAQVNNQSSDYEKDRADAEPRSEQRKETIRTIYRDRTVFSVCAVPDDARRVLAEAVSEANSRAAGEPGPAVPGAAGAPGAVGRP